MSLVENPAFSVGLEGTVNIECGCHDGDVGVGETVRKVACPTDKVTVDGGVEEAFVEVHDGGGFVFDAEVYGEVFVVGFAVDGASLDVGANVGCPYTVFTKVIGWVGGCEGGGAGGDEHGCCECGGESVFSGGFHWCCLSHVRFCNYVHYCSENVVDSQIVKRAGKKIR